MKLLKKRKKQFIIITGVLVILFLMLLLSSVLGNYENLTLRRNKKDIFSVNDLTVNKLKFLSSKEEVIDVLGEPKDTKKVEKNNYKYEEYYYPGLKLTLKENHNDYALVGAEITSSKYKTSRHIRVGSRITKLIGKYKVQNKKGNYIYKNFTKDALNDDLVKENVYFSYRNDKEILYVNKDAVIEGSPTNIAKLKVYYKYGRINKIVWSYDVR